MGTLAAPACGRHWSLKQGRRQPIFGFGFPPSGITQRVDFGALRSGLLRSYAPPLFAYVDDPPILDDERGASAEFSTTTLGE